MTWPTDDELDAIFALDSRQPANRASQTTACAAILRPLSDPLFEEGPTMAITDPVTGVRQTPEQLEAITSQQREGIVARLEGRLVQVHDRIAAFEKAAAAEKARVDAIEQARKQAETGQVEKVAELLNNREKNLVIVTTEMRTELDVLKKDFTELVARINGLQPGFFTQTPVAPKVVVPERMPAPPPAPMKSPSQIEAERQARQRAAQAETERKAREREQGA
jgi:hypothetical protein